MRRLLRRTADIGSANTADLARLIRGYLFGLTLSNGTDATNDIDLTAGECASNDAINATRRLLRVPALTKQLDATWVAGTNQGGRTSSVAIANGTWHVFAMRVGGADDVGFDTSVTGANLIVDHAAKSVRRIGSILRESAAIAPFVQDGDYFQRKASILDVSATNPGIAAVTRTLSVPVGINVLARCAVSLSPGGVSPSAHFSDLAVDDEAITTVGQSITGVVTAITSVTIRTNTSAQVRSRLSASDGTTILEMRTLGWIDRRGRDA